MRVFKPLIGTRILDFSRLIPGPFCTKILSDFGAEVIKIEDMGRGDYINLFPPHIAPDESVLGVYLNKNKKRLKLDFKSSQGQKIIKKLVKTSSVLLESYRPTVMKRFKLDAKSLHRVNAKLIYVSLTGYGQNTKRSKQAGHDINFMAVSSMMKQMGQNVSQFQMADFVGGGVFAAMQIMAALLDTKRKNLKLDVSMVDSLVYLSQHKHFSQNDMSMPNLSGQLARYNLYQAKDKRIVALGALEDKFWHEFCDIIKKPAYKKVGMGRVANKKLIPKLQSLFKKQNSSYWKKLGEKHDICMTVVAEKSDLIREGYLSPISLTLSGKSQKLRESKLFSSGKRQGYRKAGADNQLLLKELGYSQKDITKLKQIGIL